MNRFQLAERNTQIIAAIEAGISLSKVAIEFDLSYSTVAKLVKQYESYYNRQLPRLQRGRPLQTKPTKREIEIVDAYLELGSFVLVGKRFNVSAQRIYALISKYERMTGQTIPRVGRQRQRARHQGRPAPLERSL